MFFILRCVFWLSIVFAHLPAGEGGSAAAGHFLDMAGRHVDAFARQSATRAAETGAAWCKANGQACADAVLGAMRAKADAPAAADRAAPARARG